MIDHTQPLTQFKQSVHLVHPGYNSSTFASVVQPWQAKVRNNQANRWGNSTIPPEWGSQVFQPLGTATWNNTLPITVEENMTEREAWSRTRVNGPQLTQRWQGSTGMVPVTTTRMSQLSSTQAMQASST